MDDRQCRRILGRAIRYAMEIRASLLGVDLQIDQLHDGRMTFSIRRPEETPKGRGALAIGELLEMADAADIEVFIDVRVRETRLLRYYRDFGFRLVDGDHAREEREIRDIEDEVGAWKSKDVESGPQGVVTMFRNRWDYALLPDDEIEDVTAGARPPRSDKERAAQRRDAILIALQKRGMSAGQAGCRVSPMLTASEVHIRTSNRRIQGWTVPDFARHKRLPAM